MKILTTLFLFILFPVIALSQNNITNTLGSSGIFTIKDGSTNYFTLTQSTGQVNILNTLRLENTTNSTTGVIYKGTDRFLHNYYNPVQNFGENTFLGINAGNFTMSGINPENSSFNTGIGYRSLTSLTTGYNNTAVGHYSLYPNTTGEFNTAVGGASLSSNTTGDNNTAVGGYSLYSNTIGTDNTAVGTSSLLSNTRGDYNTAVGYYSLYLNKSGLYNTAVGYYSLYSNTTGDYNTAVGEHSLYSNTTGRRNTALGVKSLYSNTTGDGNTAVGESSLYPNTIGTNNTALGYEAGSTVTAGGNLTLIGYNAEPTSATATNEITLGDGNVLTLRCNTQTITSLSDARDKKNIIDLSLGLDFITTLKPRQFNWDKREWYDDNKSDGSKMREEPTAGFIAQELDEVQKTSKAEWLNLVLKNNPDKFEATPGNLLPVMVKAIQELKTENDRLKEEFAKLEQLVAELKANINNDNSVSFIDTN